MSRIVLILDNIRSAHNVGSIIRSAAALDITDIYPVGITPYPAQPIDKRLPHVSIRADKQIAKTALGAEKLVKIHPSDGKTLPKRLKEQGFKLVAIENSSKASSILDYAPKGKHALVLGNELDGVSANWLSACDLELEIPTSSNKRSLNVAAAANMAMYHFKFKA